MEANKTNENCMCALFAVRSKLRLRSVDVKSGVIVEIDSSGAHNKRNNTETSVQWKQTVTPCRRAVTNAVAATIDVVGSTNCIVHSNAKQETPKCP